MMGRLKSDQGQLFYEFRLGDAVPEDHLVRKIDAALDLSWLRGEASAISTLEDRGTSFRRSSPATFRFSDRCSTAASSKWRPRRRAADSQTGGFPT
jgi:hypothetical protein